MTVRLLTFEETQAATGLLLSAPRCQVCVDAPAGLCHCNAPDVTVPVEPWFQAPRHATQPADECDGADRPGWIEPPGPVHNHDGATQVMPASQDLGPSRRR